eukprot:g5859.t1
MLAKRERPKILDKHYVFNAARCEYDVIHEVVDELGWKSTDNGASNCSLIWIDTAVGIRESFETVKAWQLINHFPGLNDLIARKSRMYRNLHRIARVLPKEYTFLPTTYVLPEDRELLCSREFENGKTRNNRYLILKPDHMAKGKGVQLINSWDTVAEILQEKQMRHQHIVVQRYISHPMLLDGMKFDLRLYLLVTHIDPLELYLFQDGLVRLSTTEYEKPNADNFDQRCMHLTNYAVNKDSENFVMDAGDDGAGSKRSLLWFWKHVDEEYGEKERKLLWKKCKQLCVKMMLAVQPALAHEYYCGMPKDGAKLKTTNRCRCFALLGVDIMVDRNLKPWLLETNHLPSFATETDLDYDIKKRLIEQTLDLIPIVPCALGKKLIGTEEFDDLWKFRKEEGDVNLDQYEKAYPVAEETLAGKVEEQVPSSISKDDLYQETVAGRLLAFSKGFNSGEDEQGASASSSGAEEADERSQHHGEVVDVVPKSSTGGEDKDTVELSSTTDVNREKENNGNASAAAQTDTKKDLSKRPVWNAGTRNPLNARPKSGTKRKSSMDLRRAAQAVMLANASGCALAGGDSIKETAGADTNKPKVKKSIFQRYSVIADTVAELYRNQHQRLFGAKKKGDGEETNAGKEFQDGLRGAGGNNSAAAARKNSAADQAKVEGEQEKNADGNAVAADGTTADGASDGCSSSSTSANKPKKPVAPPNNTATRAALRLKDLRALKAAAQGRQPVWAAVQDEQTTPGEGPAPGVTIINGDGSTPPPDSRNENLFRNVGTFSRFLDDGAVVTGTAQAQQVDLSSLSGLQEVVSFSAANSSAAGGGPAGGHVGGSSGPSWHYHFAGSTSTSTAAAGGAPSGMQQPAPPGHSGGGGVSTTAAPGHQTQIQTHQNSETEEEMSTLCNSAVSLLRRTRQQRNAVQIRPAVYNMGSDAFGSTDVVVPRGVGSSDNPLDIARSASVNSLYGYQAAPGGGQAIELGTLPRSTTGPSQHGGGGGSASSRPPREREVIRNLPMSLRTLHDRATKRHTRGAVPGYEQRGQGHGQASVPGSTTKEASDAAALSSNDHDDESMLMEKFLSQFTQKRRQELRSAIRRDEAINSQGDVVPSNARPRSGLAMQVLQFDSLAAAAGSGSHQSGTAAGRREMRQMLPGEQNLRGHHSTSREKATSLVPTGGDFIGGTLWEFPTASCSSSSSATSAAAGVSSASGPTSSSSSTVPPARTHVSSLHHHQNTSSTASASKEFNALTQVANCIASAEKPLNPSTPSTTLASTAAAVMRPLEKDYYNVRKALARSSKPGPIGLMGDSHSHSSIPCLALDESPVMNPFGATGGSGTTIGGVTVTTTTGGGVVTTSTFLEPGGVWSKTGGRAWGFPANATKRKPVPINLQVRGSNVSPAKERPPLHVPKRPML